MRQILCPRLIGRADERRAIESALEGARHACGSTLVLVGEAGIGKSRLARETEGMAGAAGLRVLWGRCVEGGGAMPFRPITEALMSVVRHDLGTLAGRPELRPFLPILGRLIPDLRAPQAVAARADESLVLLGEAVLRVLHVIGANRGCLIVLEDLHWADSETLAVLEYLIANVRDEPVLIMATGRPELSSPWLALTRSIVAQRTGTVLDLPRLDASAVTEMASACMNEASVPEAVERLLSTSADGLPLLVEDLLAEWVSAGALVQDRDLWRVAHVLGPVVPMSFGDTVRRRLAALGSECTRILQLAALLGRRFEWSLLPAASGHADERLLDHLQAAVDAQLLSVDRTGFRFRHAMTRDAVLDGLISVRRGLESARLLELVEVRHPDLDGEWCYLAAELADATGDRVKAAALLLRAGRRSLAQGALATAEATLDRARALAPTLELSAEIDETTLRVLSEAGKTDRVFEAGQALLDTLAGARAAPIRVANAHLDIARAAVAGARLPEASQHLEHARELDTSGDLGPAIAAAAAHVAVDERQVDDAQRLARVALIGAEQAGQFDVACEALIVLGRLARATDLDRAEDAFTRAHEMAEAHGLTVWRSRALHELGTIDMFRDCSPRRLLEARELAEASGALATAASVDVELAAVHTLRFELDRGLEAAQRAREAGRRYRLLGVETGGLLFMAEVHGLRRDRAGLERLLAELPSASGDEALYLEFCRNAFRAEALLCEDNRKQAARYLGAAVEQGRKLRVAAPSPVFGEWTLTWMLDNPDGSPETEAPPEWAMVQPINRAFVHYARAVELGHRGQGAEAAESVAHGDRDLVYAPWYLHVSRRGLAEAAIRDGWGDPVGWLRASEAFCTANAYEAVASACRSLLRRCGAGPTAARGHVGVPEPFGGQGVTERELEVLMVLPEGLSNKEIAQRLYLSPKTVEKHVASLMNKLAVRSRAQLAAVASARMGNGMGSNWINSRL